MESGNITEVSSSVYGYIYLYNSLVFKYIYIHIIYRLDIYVYMYMYISYINVFISIYIYICILKTACVVQWLRRQTQSSRTRVRASSGPLINFIKWVLKYYLEVILYNCV